MKTLQNHTVEQVKGYSLMKLQKVAKELEVPFTQSMKKPALLQKVIKAIDMKPKTQIEDSKPRITAEMVNSAPNVKTLKEYASELNVKLKSNAKRQDYIDALLIKIKPVPTLKVQTVAAKPPVEGAVKLKDLKEGAKYSFIRAGKVCKAIYTLVKKNAEDAISSDNGVEWTAKILGYNVYPRA